MGFGSRPRPLHPGPLVRVRSPASIGARRLSVSDLVTVARDYVGQCVLGDIEFEAVPLGFLFCDRSLLRGVTFCTLLMRPR